MMSNPGLTEEMITNLLLEDFNAIRPPFSLRSWILQADSDYLKTEWMEAMQVGTCVIKLLKQYHS